MQDRKRSRARRRFMSGMMGVIARKWRRLSAIEWGIALFQVFGDRSSHESMSVSIDRAVPDFNFAGDDLARDWLACMHCLKCHFRIHTVDGLLRRGTRAAAVDSSVLVRARSDSLWRMMEACDPADALGEIQRAGYFDRPTRHLTRMMLEKEIGAEIFVVAPQSGIPAELFIGS